jgi:hypothetical protein
VIVVAALGLRQNPAIAAVAGLLLAGGGPVVLASFVRSRGLAEQDRLWRQWGGAPTTGMLRHHGDPAGKAERDRLRAHVGHLLGITLPAAADEDNDPAAADAAYVGAVQQLIRRTRDKTKFRLLFVENKNYGYERNLVAIRPTGLVISGLALFVLIGAAVLSATGGASLHLADPIVGAVVDAAVITIWLVVPNKDHVRRVAQAYAQRLAEASWDLNPQPGSGKAK